MDSKKWHIVYNPRAGTHRHRNRLDQLIYNMKRLRMDTSCFEFTSKQDCIDSVGRFIKKGARKIIGVGGDGTNQDIINGIFLQNNIPSQDIIYSLFPSGSGNDWARTHNFPKHPLQFARMINRSYTEMTDVGRVRYSNDSGDEKQSVFANAVGLGFDAFVVQQIEKHVSRKNKLTYLQYILKALWTYRRKEITIACSEYNLTSDFFTVQIGLGKYAGNGLQLLPTCR